MSEPTTFHTAQPVELDVRNPLGSVEVVATETDTSTVLVRPLVGGPEGQDAVARTRVELSADGRRLTVLAPERRGVFGFGRGAALAISVTVPTDSRLQLHTGAAEATGHGRFERLTANSASGAVRVAEVTGAARVRAASGSVWLGSAGQADVQTASGGVRLDHATGDVDVSVASGPVQIGVAEAAVRVRSASGDISVDEACRGEVVLVAASGDIRVGVRAGVVARLDLSTGSGRARSELPVEDAAPADGAPLRVHARTASGNVLVTRAAHASGPAA
jgi:Toastrack DUF4097